jgi:hypothetical protein
VALASELGGIVVAWFVVHEHLQETAYSRRERTESRLEGIAVLNAIVSFRE